MSNFIQSQMYESLSHNASCEEHVRLVISFNRAENILKQHKMVS